MNLKSEDLKDWLKNEIEYCKSKRAKDPKFAREAFLKSDEGFISAMEWAIKHIETLEKLLKDN